MPIPINRDNPVADVYVNNTEWIKLSQGDATTLKNITPFTCYVVVSDDTPTDEVGIGMIGYALTEDATYPIPLSSLSVWVKGGGYNHTGLQFLTT